MRRIRDPGARLWIAGGAVPVALATFAVAWALFSYGDELVPTLTLWVTPSLVVLATVRLPTWAFRLVTIPIVLVELVFSPFGPPLLAVVLLHVAALFTQRPPPLGELRRG
jgi:hypothetical protein